jgi:PAS domain S-box-containing protein
VFPLDVAMSWRLTLREEPTPARREGDRLRRDPVLLAAVLERSPVPIFTIDARGRVVVFNRACETLSGWRSDEIRGRSLGDVLLAPDERESWTSIFAPLRPERVPEREERTWTARDGRPRRVVWRHETLKDDGGVARYVVSTGHDVTELRALESRAAEIAERERERFGQDLHDGLGQDLTGLALAAGLLRARLGGASAVATRHADEIEALARRAIAKARSLARGIYPAGLVSGALPDYLRDMGRFVEETFGTRLELDWDTPPDLDEGRARNLYWIVQEAVTNAVKHGGARRVVVSSRRENGRVVVRVRDDGRGLRGSVATDGLGLKVMRARARTLGASLRVEDHVEGGVVVECALPEARGETS